MTLVKNRDELLLNYEGVERTLREKAIQIVEHAIKMADPEKLVKEYLKFENNRIVFKNKTFEFSRAYVVAIGKAAYPMAKAAGEILGEAIADGVVVTKYGYSRSSRIGVMEVIEAGHPVPDENSMKGAMRGLEIAEKVGEKDLLILLVSGGGSALFVMPEKGITLEDKIKTYELLLKSGARIQEINTVRKHISAVKGGKFVKRVKGRVLALIISDVVGDDLEAIASGISVKDPTTFEDAVRILKDYGVWDKIPESVRNYLERGLKGEVEETLKEEPENVTNELICSSSKVCEFAAEKAEELGFKAKIVSSVLEGESKDVGIVLASIASEIKRSGRPFSPPVALVFGGETTVTFSGEKAGKGGPNQELALGFAKKLFESGCKNACAIAVDTDGTDGPTDAAGGLVSHDTWERIKRNGKDPAEELMKHNAYEALKAGNALVITGPTNTNVNSMAVVLVS